MGMLIFIQEPEQIDKVREILADISVLIAVREIRHKKK